MLVVEDDPNLGTLLSEYLNAKGIDATLATNGEEGLIAYKTGEFNFCILDVMMPIKDGFTLAKEIRAEDDQIPIIFLTAKNMKQDTMEGFKAGADDYMTKPFSMEELLARISAVYKRTKGSDKTLLSERQIFNIGKYELNATTRILKFEGKESKMTSRECQLLKLLCLNIDGIMDRSQALMEIWGDDSYFNSRSMDVYITKVRKYLKGDPGLEIINVHGRGFRLIVQ